MHAHEQPQEQAAGTLQKTQQHDEESSVLFNQRNKVKAKAQSIAAQGNGPCNYDEVGPMTT